MTVMQDLSSEVALKSLGEEGRPISPRSLSSVLSAMLYSRRASPFFVEPVVAGLDARGQPYLCGQVSSGNSPPVNMRTSPHDLRSMGLMFAFFPKEPEHGPPLQMKPPTLYYTRGKLVDCDGHSTPS